MPALFLRPLLAAAAAAALATAGCGEPAAVAVHGATLRITLSEYRISPQKVRIGPGRVTLVVRNAGTIVHELALREPGSTRSVATSEPLRPGQTTRLTVLLARGDYRDACPLDRHDTLGEHGTIHVG